MDMTRRAAAEFFGTLWLVFGRLRRRCPGCRVSRRSASASSGWRSPSGLTVLTMAYAVGHISGGHFNPAVTIGLWAGGRFKSADVLPYIIAQVIGAIVAAAILYADRLGQAGLGSWAVSPPTATAISVPANMVWAAALSARWSRPSSFCS